MSPTLTDESGPHEISTRHRPPEEAFVQLLIAEHAHLSASLLHSEEDGERRASFYLTLAAAATAVLGFFVEQEDARAESTTFFLGAALTFLVVLVVGWMTHRRLVYRNVETDECIEKLNRVRKWFVEGKADGRLGYLPYNPFEGKGTRGRQPLSLGKGGWLQVVMLTNALVACLAASSGLVAIFGGGVLSLPDVASRVLLPIVIVIVFAGAWFGQARAADRIYENALVRRRAEAPPAASEEARAG